MMWVSEGMVSQLRGLLSRVPVSEEYVLEPQVCVLSASFAPQDLCGLGKMKN